MTQAASTSTIRERELRGSPAVGAASALEAPIHGLPVPATNLAVGVWPLLPEARGEIGAYQRDVWERTILFWDTLRRRADNMIAHERAGKPPLLDFDY